VTADADAISEKDGHAKQLALAAAASDKATRRLTVGGVTGAFDHDGRERISGRMESVSVCVDFFCSVCGAVRVVRNYECRLCGGRLLVAQAAGASAMREPGAIAGASSTSAAMEPEEWALRKRQAIMRGLDFLQTLGETLFRNEQLASKHGPDLLLPFYIPPAGAAATEEERHALRVATRLAAEWRTRTGRAMRYLPPVVPPKELLNLMQGLYSLECLGMGDRALHAQLEERASTWGAADFLKYDPTRGDPPATLREACACGQQLEPGASECPVCRRSAVRMSPFDAWLEALVWTFHGCRMRIGLGACFFDVLRQVCAGFARLYPRRDSLCEKDRHYLTYALTHVVYALNNVRLPTPAHLAVHLTPSRTASMRQPALIATDWCALIAGARSQFDERSLPASLFPSTVPAFLREQLHAAIKADDPDLAGEVLDCLKCLGERETSDVRSAEEFLMTRQSAADGGWVCKGEADLYSRYHASLVAVAALMDHSYAAHGPVFPHASDVLPKWFDAPDAEPEPPPKVSKAGAKLAAKQAKKMRQLQAELQKLKLQKQTEGLGDVVSEHAVPQPPLLIPNPEEPLASDDRLASPEGHIVQLAEADGYQQEELGGSKLQNESEEQDGLQHAQASQPIKAGPSGETATCNACEPCGCAEPLCDVDHTHAERRRRAAEASKAAQELVPSWPLPPQQRQVVSMLPVMRRMAVREAVLADKMRQTVSSIKREVRAEANRRFIERGGVSSATGYGRASASPYPTGAECASRCTPHRIGARSAPLPALNARATMASCIGAASRPSAGRLLGFPSEQARAVGAGRSVGLAQTLGAPGRLNTSSNGFAFALHR
jgi:hypothetical protein